MKIDDLIVSQPSWVICVVLGLLGVLKTMGYKDLDLHGRIAFWTIIVFFWISILAMAKALLF